MASRHIVATWRSAAALAAWIGLVCCAPAARAGGAGSALVIANDSYATLPALGFCVASADTVASALRDLGYDVTKQQDASTGGIDAAIGAFDRRLADRNGPAFIYICGYGAIFNDRVFLLPATARLARPVDVLAEGILLKSVVNTLGSGFGNAAVVAFDLVPRPDGPDDIGLAAFSGAGVADGVGIVGVTRAGSGELVSPLARALVLSLKGPVVRTGELLDSVRAQLAGGKIAVAALHMPVRQDYLAGSPPPEPPAIAAQPEPEAVKAPTAVVRPAKRLPDEDRMTEAQRQMVQQALTRLGYYSGSVDGIFGPDSRAAIRRYQHEIGAEMTGHIGAEQATGLVAMR